VQAASRTARAFPLALVLALALPAGLAAGTAEPPATAAPAAASSAAAPGAGPQAASLAVPGAAGQGAAPQAAPAASAPAAGTLPAAFDPRYGIAPGADLASLVDKPTLVSMQVRQWKDPATGEGRLAGYGDAHAVYEVPLAAVAATLGDYLGRKAYSPRIREMRIESVEGPSTLLYEDIGIVFLGVKVGYLTRSEIVRDELPGGAVGFRARLVESLDGKLFSATSSWYLEEVEVGGRRMTYLRAYSNPGIRSPGLGMGSILKAFTPSELATMLEQTVRAARKRAKGS